MQTEKGLINTHRISPKEHVPFHCTGCGECCRHVHQSIPLESLDVYHIAQYLRGHDTGIFCTDDFIGQYAELVLLDACGFFVLMLKTTGSDDACIFLKGNRCMIHAAKPRACRIYPFVAGITPNGQYEFLLSKERSHHFKGKIICTKTWMKRYFTVEDRAFLKLDFGSVAEIARLMRMVPESERRTAMLLFWRYRYSEFNLDQPFLPQYEKNLHLLKAALNSLIDRA